jgi:hypothetical protein
MNGEQPRIARASRTTVCLLLTGYKILAAAAGIELKPGTTDCVLQLKGKHREKRPPFLRHNSQAAQTFLEYSSGGFVGRDLLTNIGFHIKRSD